MMSPGPAVATSPNLLQEWRSLLELACREVFDLMLNSKLEHAGEAAATRFEITGMVGLAGQLCGLVSLRCSSQAAACMASRMLGTEIAQGDKQMFDAIGEITNMVAGNFKNKLTGLADKCMLSVPTVITGSDYSCRSMADTPPLTVVLNFENSPLAVFLEIHS